MSKRSISRGTAVLLTGAAMAIAADTAVAQEPPGQAGLPADSVAPGDRSRRRPGADGRHPARRHCSAENRSANRRLVLRGTRANGTWARFCHDQARASVRSWPARPSAWRSCSVSFAQALRRVVGVAGEHFAGLGVAGAQGFARVEQLAHLDEGEAERLHLLDQQKPVDLGLAEEAEAARRCASRG